MKTKTHIVGLTGGIATGKSTCIEILRELLSDITVFDADVCVHHLYEDQRVILQVRESFGSAALTGNGKIDRSYLRNRIFESTDDKTILEGILHPRVREECLALLSETLKKGSSSLFVADVPLLFENRFDFGQSINLLVATSKETQTARLIQRSKWDVSTVRSVISSQLPIDAKHGLADVVFWNEGDANLLYNQCTRFLKGIGIDF